MWPEGSLSAGPDWNSHLQCKPKQTTLIWTLLTLCFKDAISAPKLYKTPPPMCPIYTRMYVRTLEPAVQTSLVFLSEHVLDQSLCLL